MCKGWMNMPDCRQSWDPLWCLGPQICLRLLPTDFSIMQAVQATMILSTILCSLSFLIFLLQLFRLKQGERFILTAIIQLMSCK